MQQRRLFSFIGLSGVAKNENVRAQRVGKRFEVPMLLLAVWVVALWYTERKGLLSQDISYLLEWVIWMFFVVETVVLTWLVDNKLYYLRTNWINVLIITLGLPILWNSFYAGILRSLRLLLLLTIIVNSLSTVRQLLAKNHLGVTILVGAAFIIIAGVLIAGIDPAIDSVWQGLWWAWVTVTTVGYGDVVPSSNIGKLFGAVLILLGIALFSLLTANFSAFFIGKDEQQTQRSIKKLDEKLDELEEKLNRIQSSLDNINKQ